MRIAIDIDSTLHHYWDLLAAAAQRRFGIELPYEEQLTWDITRLKPEQLRACIAETHSDAAILAAEPYPGAVESSRWHDAGHFIHITSHRAERCHAATSGGWSDRPAVRRAYCSYDKVAPLRELGIDLLIDDSPVNLAARDRAGIAAATILHPWNRELCEKEPIVCGADWPELAAELEAPAAAGALRRYARPGMIR